MTDPVAPMVVSNSTIQTFKRCRRKWMLSYVLMLAKKEQALTGPLPFGGRVHRALEQYYKAGGDITAVWSALVAEDRFKFELTEQTPEDVKKFDSEAELGQIMLEGFVEWVTTEGIDATVDIVSNEERLSTLVLDGRVELQAKIDMRVKRKSDGVLMVRDFKTAAQMNDLTRSLYVNEQLLTYMVIENIVKGTGERCDGGELLMMKKVKRSVRAKPPFYEQAVVYHNMTTLRNFWTRLAGTLTDMLSVYDALAAGADHRFVAYPRPTNDCSWDCPFVTICPMFDDGSAVEQAMLDMFDVVDPYAYYEDKEFPS